MNLNVSGAFVYFTIPVFGGIPVTQTMVSSLVVTLILIVAFVRLGRNLQKRPSGIQVMVEKGVGMLYKMVGESMGEHNLHWTPFIGAIFLSSVMGSFIGLTGFLRSTTADLSCVLVWALMVTLIIWYNNIKRNGFVGWLKGFTEPTPVMTPMNLISEVSQPVSMTFRHFGNIAGGGIITSILYLVLSMASATVLNAIAANGVSVSVALLSAGIGILAVYRLRMRKKRLLVPGLACALLGVFGLLQALNVLSGVPVLAYGIPAVLSCYFDLFSGFVQGYVFTLLSMTYIGNSCPPPETAGAEQ